MKWAKENIIEDANKSATRTHWHSASPGLYNAAKKMGFFDECVAHMHYHEIKRMFFHYHNIDYIEISELEWESNPNHCIQKINIFLGITCA